MQATIGMTTFGHSENVILRIMATEIYFFFMFQDGPPPKKPYGCTYSKHSFFSPNTSISVSTRSSPPPPKTSWCEAFTVKCSLILPIGEVFISRRLNGRTPSNILPGISMCVCVANTGYTKRVFFQRQLFVVQ